MDNTQILEKLEKKLNDIESKVQEQNETIARLYRLQKISTYTRYAYWLFLLMIAFGAFYFLNPVIDSLKNVYGGQNGIFDIMQTMPELNAINEFRNQVELE